MLKTHYFRGLTLAIVALGVAVAMPQAHQEQQGVRPRQDHRVRRPVLARHELRRD